MIKIIDIEKEIYNGENKVRRWLALNKPK